MSEPSSTGKNYRKVFSVINAQTVSTVIARYAISLAAACKAELVLYAAHEEDCHATDRHLEHLVTVASGLGIPVTRITESGDISRLLPKRVQMEKADLVFYPLTPCKPYGDDLQRRIVSHLLRTVSSDLAIMRAISMGKPHPRHILVPLGKTISDSERRLQFVARLAGSFHAQVTLYHLLAARDVKAMPDVVAQFGKQLQELDIKVLERSGSGLLGKAITVEAITRHNDLIILGASERGVLRKMFFGNPAGDVMQQPPCNAILFRAAL